MFIHALMTPLPHIYIYTDAHIIRIRHTHSCNDGIRGFNNFDDLFEALDGFQLHMFLYRLHPPHPLYMLCCVYGAAEVELMGRLIYIYG